MQQTTAKNDSKSEETHKAIVSKFQHQQRNSKVSKISSKTFTLVQKRYKDAILSKFQNQQTNSKVSKISSKTFTVVPKCYKDHVNVLWQ